MSKKIFYISAVLIWLLNCSCFGKSEKADSTTPEWIEITQQAKPWTRWWIFGSAMTKKDVTAQLEAFQKAGLGGVEITPIYGTRGAEDKFIDYLSPEWMRMLEYILKEAKRLDLGVDLANASGWPFGGPWVDEEIACKNMQSKTFRLNGGQKLDEKITFRQKPLAYSQGTTRIDISKIKEPIEANENQQEYAFAQVQFEKDLPLIIVTASKVTNGKTDFSETIDLTTKVKDGTLDWTAPEGEWLICALFQGDHGKMVERASPGGEGNVIDHFSTKALDTYLAKFDKAFAGYDVSYLRYYFNDSYEVDDALGSANWTPEMFTEFNRIKGYDLKNYIPALLGLADEDTNRRVLYDFRELVSELMLERFTKKWQKWAAKQGKGIRNQSHGSPANVLDLYAASDIAETEGGKVLDIKSASSVTHVMGKKLTSAESCTLLNEHFHSTLGDVKKANDRFLLGGVNHIFYHGTDYSPQDAPFPGWLFYAAVHFTPANTFWDDFGALNNYVARSQSFLQAGKPSNDILLYYGISDLWSTSGEEMFHYFHSFKTVSMDVCAKYLLDNGYTWDAITDKQLLNVKTNGAELQTGGNSYKNIVVPKLEYIPLKTFEQLMALANAGAVITFHEQLPSDVPGLAGLEKDRRKLKSLKDKLNFKTNGDVRIAAYGKGKIIVSDKLTGLTTGTDIQPESMYKQGLESIRRKKDDGNYYYFILNPSKSEFSDWVTLTADYKSGALYNPMTGKTGFAKTREHNGNTEIWLQLKPNESMIVETFRTGKTCDLYPFYAAIGKGVELNNWNIEFVKGGPFLPKAIKNATELKSWTDYGDGYTSFSGTVEYVTHIPQLNEKADAWQLSFAQIDASAAVYLNDAYLGTLIDAPYTLEIPSALLKGNDVLKVKVSNLMANRIADMDKKGMEWRIFYNANVESKERKNIGKDGKFSAEKWQPKPSGISGAVTLIPLSQMK